MWFTNSQKIHLITLQVRPSHAVCCSNHELLNAQRVLPGSPGNSFASRLSVNCVPPLLTTTRSSRSKSRDRCIKACVWKVKLLLMRWFLWATNFVEVPGWKRINSKNYNGNMILYFSKLPIVMASEGGDAIINRNNRNTRCIYINSQFILLFFCTVGVSLRISL
jgi:hypothetical protein